MAAAVDGTILIDSHIITDGLNSDIAAVEDRLRQVAKRTRRAGGHAAAAATGNAEYDEVARQLAEAEREADRLQKKFDGLVDKEERFIATGGDVDSKTFKGYEYDIEKTTQAMAENDATIAGLRDRLAELDQSALQTANAENQGATAAEQLSDAVHGVADASSHAAATTTGLGKGTITTASGFKGLLRTILKYGLGIRSVYILFRKLRQAIIEGFKNLAQVDNQTNESISTLKSSLSQLKNSFAAAFAPVLNAVAPILNKLIRMLVTAANYVGMFFAALSGASSYRPAIYAYEDYADSLNNAAGAAADAAKNLSGLDEMNVWQENSGGGGGGTSPADMFGDEEAIPNSVANIAEKVKSIFMAVYNAIAPVLKDLWNLLVFEADDVLFNWDNLSSEDILEKIVAGFGLVFGAIAGFSITHSVKGLIIGAVVGLAITLLLDGVVFDDDGRISGDEIFKLIFAALAAAAGAVIGFHFGGLKGAVIGAVITTSITILLNTIEFDADPIKNADIKGKIEGTFMSVLGGVTGLTIGSAFGPVGSLVGLVLGVAVGAVIGIVNYKIQQDEAARKKAIDDLYASVGTTVEKVEEALQEAEDINIQLRANISVISDEIKPEDLAKLQVAKDLIEKIYSLDAVDNKSGGQMEQMISSINLLNDMSLDGIQIEYDELTGKVLTARDTVEELIASIEKQVQIEAIKNAWVESWEAYYKAQAEYNRLRTSDTLLNAQAAYENAWNEYREAEEAQKKAEQDYYENGNTQAYEAAIERTNRAGQAFWNAASTFNGYTSAVDDANAAMQAAADMVDYYSGKYDDIWRDACADAKEYAAFYKQQFEQGIEGFTAKGLFEAKVAAGELEKTWTDAAGEAEAYAAWYKECFENGLAGFTKEGLAEAEQFATDMHTTLNTAAETAETNGENIALGLAEGIKGKAQEAIKAAKKLAQDVLDPLKNIPQIASPAKVTRGYGRFISLGYALGITDEIGAAENAASSVANSALAGMMTTFSGTKLPFSRIASGSIIPTAAALGAGSSGDTDLLGILREALAEFFGTKTSRSTSITAKVNSRTLFDVMIEEGRQRMRANGRNPFTDIAML